MSNSPSFSQTNDYDKLNLFESPISITVIDRKDSPRQIKHDRKPYSRIHKSRPVYTYDETTKRYICQTCFVYVKESKLKEHDKK